MADRRMFSKSIADSDQFMDMSLSAQAFYFHLCLRADDDGFVNNARGIQRSIGASAQDMAELVDQKYVLPFQSGVVVIRHWKIHNIIQKDRYHTTIYSDEYQQLHVLQNKEYRHVSELDTSCIQSVSEPETELGKISIDKERVEETSAENTPPSLDEIRQWMTAYAVSERVTFNVDQQAQKFHDYYSAHGWKNSSGCNVQDWEAAVRLWIAREKDPDAKPKAQRVKEFR